MTKSDQIPIKGKNYPECTIISEHLQYLMLFDFLAEYEHNGDANADISDVWIGGHRSPTTGCSYGLLAVHK